MDQQPTETLLDKPLAKPPVVRGARACTVCRAAKMKCVGAEDGQKQCQRCKRANAECIFEKHRRGRKPGSKLSEASKMLRRLEKGLNNAKLKSQASDMAYSDARSGHPDSYRAADRVGPSGSHFASTELPPLSNLIADGSANRNMEIDDDEDDEDEDDNERSAEGMYPAKLIRKEHQRNSFFSTVLGPERDQHPSPRSSRGNSFPSPQLVPAPIPSGLNDPITAGIIDDDDAKTLFDLLFLRLNPFINLFDPALHSVAYVRSKCPFLFTTLIMASCKFFKHDQYKPCLKLAHEFAIRAFADAWKRVEVVQAFACLTYWKEPDDNRTWTYIGYACRMAVELGLNRYWSKPPARETEFQMRERRNRERTYLVLFVHDRSLSMQTGRHWMLPEDELVRHSSTWHEEGGSVIRPEDVIISAFVQLRRVAAETTDMFYTNKGGHHNDVNYDVVLRNCNGKLTQWMDTWKREMQRAPGADAFHMSFLSFFRLYCRLFLNSFGIQASMSPTSRTSPSLQALSACYTSAVEALQIVSKEFAQISMLRYSQESITVMTAYSAVFLLKLLRSSSTLSGLHEGATEEIHSLISKTADAYHEPSALSPASTSAAYHARFLRSLVANDRYKARQQTEKDRAVCLPVESRLQGSHAPAVPQPQNLQPQTLHGIYPQSVPHAHDYSFQVPQSLNNQPHQPSPYEEPYTADPIVRHGPMSHLNGIFYSNAAPAIPHATDLDARYWRNMFLELGYAENVESGTGSVSPPGESRVTTFGGQTQNHQQHNLPQYHQIHSIQAGYGH